MSSSPTFFPNGFPAFPAAFCAAASFIARNFAACSSAAAYSPSISILASRSLASAEASLILLAISFKFFSPAFAAEAFL